MIDKELDAAIGLRMAELRGDHDARWAAAKAGVDVRSWRKWEGGNPTNRAVYIVKICDAFNCSCDWLICGDGPRERTAA